MKIGGEGRGEKKVLKLWAFASAIKTPLVFGSGNPALLPPGRIELVVPIFKNVDAIESQDPCGGQRDK